MLTFLFTQSPKYQRTKSNQLLQKVQKTATHIVVFGDKYTIYLIFNAKICICVSAGSQIDVY